MLRIGEFSKLSQTSVKTLRYYDAVSLLRPAYVDRQSGYRYYSPEQVTELGRILHLKMLGFSLRHIRDLLAGHADGQCEILIVKRREIARRIRDERVKLAALDGWLDQLGRGTVVQPAVTLKRLPAQPVASIRASVRCYSEATAFFHELHLFTDGSRLAAGPPAAIWHTCGDSGQPIDCEAVVPLEQRASSTRRIRVYERPAMVVATLVHRGELSTAGGAYRAARSWIAANGFAVAGSKREIYWRGGLDQDRACDLTEIQFPIVVARDRRGVEA